MKLKYNLKWQDSLISILLDKSNKLSPSLIDLIEGDYFELLENEIIVSGLKKYFIKNKRVPPDYILIEAIKSYIARDNQLKTVPNITQEVLVKLEQLYSINASSESQDILNEIIKFRKYCEFSKLLTNYNPSDYDKAADIQNELDKISKIGVDSKKSVRYNKVIGDRGKRKYMTQLDEQIIPTPFRQLNDATNSKGLTKGSVICVIGPAKDLKTTLLISVGVGYTRRRKNVLLVALEDNELNLINRAEQNYGNISKNELYDLDNEKTVKLDKILRNYKRFNAEFIIERIPQGSTTRDIKSLLDKYEAEGIKIDILLIDYPALMASLSGREDEKGINDVYIDIESLTNTNDIEHCWTVHHINHEATKKIESGYSSTDTSYCKTIDKHVHMMLGLNYTAHEVESGVRRLQVIVQRDGPPSTLCKPVYLWANLQTQRLKEFTKDEIEEVDKQVSTAAAKPQKEKPKRIKTNGDQ